MRTDRDSAPRGTPEPRAAAVEEPRSFLEELFLARRFLKLGEQTRGTRRPGGGRTWPLAAASPSPASGWAGHPPSPRGQAAQARVGLAGDPAPSLGAEAPQEGWGVGSQPTGPAAFRLALAGLPSRAPGSVPLAFGP